MNNNMVPSRSIDTCGEVCPMNMVRTKFELQDMLPGEILEVTLEAGEPVRNVSRSVKEDGNRVIKLEKCDTYYRMLIQKGE